MKNCLFIADRKQLLYNCYPASILEESKLFSKEELLEAPAAAKEAEYLFSTWSVPILDAKQIEEIFPNVKAIFYAAGSVKHFAPPYFERGARVFCSRMANAVPVSEFAFAQILLANIGYFQMPNRFLTSHKTAYEYSLGFPGNYDVSVGLLGAGAIGRKVIDFLKLCDVEILVYDPFLTEEAAQAMGVKKASLEEIFANCQTISNHIPNIPETVGVLNYDLFKRMKKNATFINTGRGRQVVHPDLIRAMEEEPDRTALLDVTDPEEPLPENHPLTKCKNILITPHRAGATANEVRRLGQYMLDEHSRLIRGEECQHEILRHMLDSMA